MITADSVCYTRRSKKVGHSIMKSIFETLAIVLVLVAVAFGLPEQGFYRGRPGGIGGGSPGNLPLMNRPKPPQRPPPYA